MLSSVDAWVPALRTCLSDKETKGGQRLKLYDDTRGKVLGLAVEQLIGNDIESLQHCSADEMMPKEGGKMTYIVEVPLTTVRFMCVDKKRFLEYTGNELRAV